MVGGPNRYRPPSLRGRAARGYCMGFWSKLNRQGKADAFATDTRGNFATMFAITIPVLIGSIGLAVDVSNNMNIKSRLVAAADAAVLAGVKTGSQAASEGDLDWLKQANDEASALFFGNIATENLKNVQFAPTFTRTGTTVEGDATYSYLSPTYFMQFFGNAAVQIGQTSKAAIKASNYVDIGFLIDNSGSMGIGATPADQQKMVAASGCAFACHLPRSDGEAKFTPDAAHAVGAKIRMDIARDALLKAVEDLEKRQLDAGQLRISLYTFSNTLKTVAKDESNLAVIKAKIQGIGIAKGDDGDKQYGGTYLTAALKELGASAKKGGDGNSKNSRKSFLVVFSDGIDDSVAIRPRPGGIIGALLALLFQNDMTNGVYNRLSTWSENPVSLFVQGEGSIVQPFIPDACETLKAKAQTVFAARVKYVAAAGFDKNWWDRDKVNFITGPAADDIEDAFANCASKPEYVVTAESSAEIAPTFQKILDEILDAGGLRLTN